MRSNTSMPVSEDLIKSTYRSLLAPSITNASGRGGLAYKFPTRRDGGIPVYENIEHEIDHMAKLLPSTTSDVNYPRLHVKLVGKCTVYREARIQELYHKTHGIQFQKRIAADQERLEALSRDFVAINKEILKHGASIRRLGEKIAASDDDPGKARMEREMHSMHEDQQGRSKECGKIMEKVYRVVNEANLKAAQLHVCEMEHRAYAELARGFQKEAWVLAGHFGH